MSNSGEDRPLVSLAILIPILIYLSFGIIATVYLSILPWLRADEPLSLRIATTGISVALLGICLCAFLALREMYDGDGSIETKESADVFKRVDDYLFWHVLISVPLSH